MAAVPTATSAYILATQMNGHGAPVALLSTSPKREDTILVRDPFVD